MKFFRDLTFTQWKENTNRNEVKACDGSAAIVWWDAAAWLDLDWAAYIMECLKGIKACGNLGVSAAVSRD